MARPSRALLRLGIALLICLVAVGGLWLTLRLPATAMAAAVTPQAAIQEGAETTTATQQDAEEVAFVARFLAGEPAATDLTLNYGLHSKFASGATPRPDPITISVMRSGTLVSRITTTPIPDGPGIYRYSAPLLYYPDRGDVLQVTQAGQKISLTIPLAFTAYADRGTSAVFGQAPTAATLDVFLYHAADPIVTYYRIVTSTAEGRYRAEFGDEIAFDTQDTGYVFYADEVGNHVYLLFNVPFLQVGLDGGERFSGRVAPLAPVTITILPFTGEPIQPSPFNASATGDFTSYTYPYLQISDIIVVAAGEQVLTLTIPPLLIQADAASDAVHVQTLGNAPVQVDLYRGPLGRWYGSELPSQPPDARITGTADATGGYTASFTTLGGINPGDYGVVFLTDPAGDRFYRRFATPFLRAHLGSFLCDGQVASRGIVTVTVRGESHAIRTSFSIWTESNGSFSASKAGNDQGLHLWPGDSLTIRASDGSEMALPIPELTASADWAHNIVSGRAPPGSRLRVMRGMGYPASGYVMPGAADRVDDASAASLSNYEVIWVTATVEGFYTADFSGLATMQPGDRGVVVYISPEGYELYLDYVAVGTLRVQIGGSRVDVISPYWNLYTCVRASTPAGVVKGEGCGYSGSYSAFWLADRSSGRPIVLIPGDILVATNSQWALTTTVPTLTVQADHVSDVISGEAPPDTPLLIRWTNRSWVVTTTTTGAYSLPLAGLADLVRGDRVEVNFTAADRVQVWAERNLSRLIINLGDEDVNVVGAAYSAITLTVLGPQASPVITRGTVLDMNGWAQVPLSSGITPVLTSGVKLIAQFPDETLEVVIPRLTAAIDADDDAVTGEAPPDAPVLVRLVGHYWNSQTVTATAAGDYRADFRGKIDLGPYTSGSVTYTDVDGDQVVLGFAVPHVAVIIGEPTIAGTVAASGPITVTLRDVGGVLRGSNYGRAGRRVFRLDLLDSRRMAVPVHGGDVLTIESVESTQTFVVPALRAEIDRKTGILTGNAPPRARLVVTLHEYTRSITTEADGNFAMDWRDLALRPGEYGSLLYTDVQTNQVTLAFRVSLYRYLPMTAK